MFLHSCLLMDIDIFDDSSSTKVGTQKNGFDWEGSRKLVSVEPATYWVVNC